jgi:hypothetical protein
MASSYDNDLRLNEMATGDGSGTWGTTTNTNLELIAEAFSYGTEVITTNADTHTTTIADGATDPGRSLYLKYTGTLDSACTITIAPNDISKVWIIENGTSGSQNIIISQGSGANITIPAGDTKVVYSDGAGAGAAFFDAFASLSVVDLKVQDDLTVTDAALVTGVLTTTATQVATGGITSGSDIISDTDSTDSLGSTGVRWLKGWFDTLTAGTLTVGSGSVTDSSGAISFGDENLTTTGIVTAAGTSVFTNLDISGDIDVDGTTNLDVVDIDGAVDMASTLDVTGAITGTLATAAQPNITSVGTLTGFTSTGIDDNADVTALIIDSDENVLLTGAGTGSRYLLLDEVSTYAGSLTIQAGAGSAAFGGGLVMYGHSHASKAGDVVAGISSGSSGSFRVNTTGLDSGSDVFVVKASGFVGIGTTTPTSVSGAAGPVLRMEGSNPEIVFADNSGTANQASNYYLNNQLIWFSPQKTGGAGTVMSLVTTSGNFNVVGALSKGSGSFKINHPLEAKTDTHHLIHSFIEGPQADLIYRGKVDLVAGSATANIDTVAGMTEGTFVTLNREVQCFTTNESNWDAVKGSVSGNILTIESENSESTATISWLVIGERQDQHMYDTDWTDENGKVIVEPIKS